MPGEEGQIDGQIEGQGELSAEAAALAEYGRTGVKPDDQAAAPAERPADVPEKFWDAEKGAVNTEALLKSYIELEKFKGGKPEGEAPAGDGTKIPPEAAQDGQQAANEGGENGADNGTDADPSGPLAEAFASAAEAYATNNGELPQESREALIKAGIPSATIDLYLQGVKAQEKALEASAHEVAGGADQFKAAVAWAADNWSPEEIDAFNGSVGNPKLIKLAVGGLMAAYKAGAGGEGRLTNINAGAETGTVYQHKDEFLKDLAEADAKNDANARRAAVQKLERSKKAGTLKNVTPRSGPFSH